MTHPHIPVDNRQITETDYSEDDYRKATEEGKAIRDRILANPDAAGAYRRATEEIALHQQALAKLRQAHGLTQATVAQLMGMNQSEISRLERRSDLLLSTLRRFIQATGGRLLIVAKYPEGEVQVSLSPDLEAEETEEPPTTDEEARA